jgi:hypothetical protein
VCLALWTPTHTYCVFSSSFEIFVLDCDLYFCEEQFISLCLLLPFSHMPACIWLFICYLCFCSVTHVACHSSNGCFSGSHNKGAAWPSQHGIGGLMVENMDRFFSAYFGFSLFVWLSKGHSLTEAIWAPIPRIKIYNLLYWMFTVHLHKNVNNNLQQMHC